LEQSSTLAVGRPDTVCTTLQTDHFLLLKLVISSLPDAQEKTWLARPDNLYPKCGFAISVSIEKALASDH